MQMYYLTAFAGDKKYNNNSNHVQVEVRTQSENIEKSGSLHKNTAGDTLLSRKQAIISTFCLNILVTVPNYATHWFSI